jgi:hypothetical protein
MSGNSNESDIIVGGSNNKILDSSSVSCSVSSSVCALDALTINPNALSKILDDNSGTGLLFGQGVVNPSGGNFAALFLDNTYKTMIRIDQSGSQPVTTKADWLNPLNATPAFIYYFDSAIVKSDNANIIELKGSFSSVPEFALLDYFRWSQASISNEQVLSLMTSDMHLSFTGDSTWIDAYSGTNGITTHPDDWVVGVAGSPAAEAQVNFNLKS